MKLYLEDDNGNKTELKELSEATVDSDVLIFKLNTNTKANADMLTNMTQSLEKITGKKCIILGDMFDKVYGVKC